MGLFFFVPSLSHPRRDPPPKQIDVLSRPCPIARYGAVLERFHNFCWVRADSRVRPSQRRSSSISQRRRDSHGDDLRRGVSPARRRDFRPWIITPRRCVS